MKTVRVAALQFGVTDEPSHNLAACMRMIDRALTECQPQLLVLPEGCCAPQAGLEFGGGFLTALAVKAQMYQCYLVVNGVIRYDDGKKTNTSLLYDPRGKVIGLADKQVLFGDETQSIERAREVGDVIATPIGRLGLCIGTDGLLPETPRSLALRGAQIICHSLNTNAHDEATLSVRARAAENRVFVIAANQTVLGESQIVSPTGVVLAHAMHADEAVVWADLDLEQADDKQRPDGTDVFAERRPKLYSLISQPPIERDYAPAPNEMRVATYQPEKHGTEAIDEVAQLTTRLVSSGTQLLVLPELFFVKDAVVEDPHRAAQLSEKVIEVFTNLLDGTGGFVAMSVVEKFPEGGFRHLGVLLNRHGIVMRQPQLHHTARHPWVTELGNALLVTQWIWGRLALIVGDDTLYPETFRLAALQGAEVIAAPMHAQEQWELDTGLIERAAENRVCVIAATRPTPFGASVLTTLEAPPAQDGHLSYPIVRRANGHGLTQATIHPANTQNKFIAPNTHLLDNRPWDLAEAITRPQ